MKITFNRLNDVSKSISIYFQEVTFFLRVLLNTNKMKEALTV